MDDAKRAFLANLVGECLSIVRGSEIVEIIFLDKELSKQCKSLYGESDLNNDLDARAAVEKDLGEFVKGFSGPTPVAVPDKKTRTLVLSEVEWLALNHELDRHAMGSGDLQNNCPFLYHHLGVINQRMLDASGIKDSASLEGHPDYEKWYEDNRVCDRCTNYHTLTEEQKNAGEDEEILCPNCLKEEEK